MKLKIFILCLGAIFFFNQKSHAQWVVTDPTNFAGNLVNSVKEIFQTSTTASNMVKNFQETVKIYKQGKAYYDALKQVKGLVKDARKVQQTILMIGDISDIYVHNYQKMLSDPYFNAEELNAIAKGYAILLEESSNVLADLKVVVNESGLSMNDKERMDIISSCYEKVFEYRGLVQYYTNKNIGVSYLRAKKQNDADRVLALYGNPNDRYW